MSRQSRDELAPDGTILNGFDYRLQVWVKAGVVLCCGHPNPGICGCNGGAYHGAQVALIPGHEVRP